MSEGKNSEDCLSELLVNRKKDARRQIKEFRMSQNERNSREGRKVGGTQSLDVVKLTVEFLLEKGKKEQRNDRIKSAFLAWDNLEPSGIQQGFIGRGIRPTRKPIRGEICPPNREIARPDERFPGRYRSKKPGGSGKLNGSGNERATKIFLSRPRVSDFFLETTEFVNDQTA